MTLLYNDIPSDKITLTIFRKWLRKSKVKELKCDKAKLQKEGILIYLLWLQYKDEITMVVFNPRFGLSAVLQTNKNFKIAL